MERDFITEEELEDLQAKADLEADTWEKERRERTEAMSENEAYEYKKSTEN